MYKIKYSLPFLKQSLELIQDGSIIHYKKLDTSIDERLLTLKAILNKLPKHQQIIVNAIAKNVKLSTVKELKVKTRLSSKVTSAQLSQLIKKGIVVSVPLNKKNNGYLLRDCIFYVLHAFRYLHTNKDRQLIYLSKLRDLIALHEKEFVRRKDLYFLGRTSLLLYKLAVLTPDNTSQVERLDYILNIGLIKYKSAVCSRKKEKEAYVIALDSVRYNIKRSFVDQQKMLAVLTAYA